MEPYGIIISALTMAGMLALTVYGLNMDSEVPRSDEQENPESATPTTSEIKKAA